MMNSSQNDWHQGDIKAESDAYFPVLYENQIEKIKKTSQTFMASLYHGL